jgi:hypothetical protein
MSSNRVNIRMCIRIQDIHFVFVFENIQIHICIRVKCGKRCYPNPIPCVSDPFPSILGIASSRCANWTNIYWKYLSIHDSDVWSCVKFHWFFLGQYQISWLMYGGYEEIR